MVFIQPACPIFPQSIHPSILTFSQPLVNWTSSQSIFTYKISCPKISIFRSKGQCTCSLPSPLPYLCAPQHSHSLIYSPAKKMLGKGRCKNEVSIATALRPRRSTPLVTHLSASAIGSRIGTKRYRPAATTKTAPHAAVQVVARRRHGRRVSFASH